MINNAYNQGRTAALVRFKLAQGMPGMPSMGATPGASPTSAGGASTAPPGPASVAPPTSAAPPMATGASKARALG